jgi:hypothetical protein
MSFPVGPRPGGGIPSRPKAKPPKAKSPNSKPPNSPNPPNHPPSPPRVRQEVHHSRENEEYLDKSH